MDTDQIQEEFNNNISSDEYDDDIRVRVVKHEKDDEVEVVEQEVFVVPDSSDVELESDHDHDNKGEKEKLVQNKQKDDEEDDVTSNSDKSDNNDDNNKRKTRLSNNKNRKMKPKTKGLKKKSTGTTAVKQEKPQQYVVEAILDKRGSGAKTKYLVKWFGFPGEDTWEVAKNLSSCQDIVLAFEEEYKIKKRAQREEEAQKSNSNSSISSGDVRKQPKRSQGQKESSVLVETAPKQQAKKTASSTTMPRLGPCTTNNNYNNHNHHNANDNDGGDGLQNVSPEVEKLLAKLRKRVKSCLPYNKIPVRMLTAEKRQTTPNYTNSNSSSSSTTTDNNNNKNLVYVIEWKNNLPEHNNNDIINNENYEQEEEEEEFTIDMIDGKVFSRAYPQMVIDFYENNLLFV